MNEVKSRSTVFRLLSPFISKERFSYGMIFLIKVALILTALIGPFLQQLFNSKVFKENKVEIIPYVIGGFIGLFFIETILSALSKRNYNHVFLKFKIRLRKFLLNKFGRMDMTVASSYEAGDMKNTIVDDMDVTERFLSTHCIDYVINILTVVVLLIVMLIMNPILTAFGAIMVPISFLFVKVMSKKVQKVSKKYRQEYGEYEDFLHTNIQNWREIKAYGLEEESDKHIKEKWNVLTRLFIKNQVYWYINRSFVSFKDFFVTRMNLYFIGGVLIIFGFYDVALLILFMSYYEKFYKGIEAIIDSIVQYKIDYANVSKVIKTIEIPISEKKACVIQGSNLVLSHVAFSYQKDKPVLRDINMHISSGENVAIVGASGAGKTTLLKLLYGLYQPSSGQISIGDKMLSEVNVNSIAKKISIVLQDPVLFNLSIEENFKLISPNATMEQIENACAKSGILDFIQGLPEGFNTIVGERGIKLSGGQKQRIAIARTILIDSEVIIFDEITSSLDYENEKRIHEAMEYLSMSKTVITVAHRLSTVIKANKIFVLDKGEIVAVGTHNELMNSNNIYQKLFSTQYINV